MRVSLSLPRSYIPTSVPSPTFPGLEEGHQATGAEDSTFSFMHDSEVARPGKTRLTGFETGFRGGMYI